MDCYRKSRLLWWFLGGFAKKKIIVARGKITVKRQMYYIATRNKETPMRTTRKTWRMEGYMKIDIRMVFAVLAAAFAVLADQDVQSF